MEANSQLKLQTCKKHIICNVPSSKLYADRVWTVGHN